MTINGSDKSIIWLTYALEANTRRFHMLAEAFDGDIDAVYASAKAGALRETKGMRAELAATLESRAKDAWTDERLCSLNASDIRAVTITSDDYPALLKNISDPPPVLFSRGVLKGDIELPIAVVGSRVPSDYGRRMADSLAYTLSERGVCIVSGLAYGIDCIAARAALRARDNDYPTIAVLGGGVDRLYPESNRATYNEIVERGAVISEYLPGTKPERYFFPARNRLISGLSRGVLVVEAARKSGTLITVDAALDQGRDVFAVPGRANDFKSEGVNGLISEGAAKLVMRADDILSEYGAAASEPAKNQDRAALRPEQKLIVSALENGEHTFDELAEMTSMPAAELNSALTEMELSGIIKQSPGRLFGL